MMISRPLFRRFRAAVLLSVMSLCSIQFSFAQLPGGTYTVGGPAAPYFNSLTDAFNSITAQGITGPVILELQSGYSSAGETFPLSFPTNATNVNTITVQPAVSGLSVLNTGATATFALTGASYCIIDGRVGGTGTVRDLVIESSDVAGQAIALTNDASNNIFRYCIVKGASTNGSSGVISIGNGILTGCDNNRIEFCDVTASTSTPRNCIYSLGISAADNSGNVVSNCNIYDFYHASLDMAGILLGQYNYNWLIENSSFYQTTSRNTSGTIMAIQSSSTNSSRLRINGNKVGGTAPDCGGSAMTITGTGVIRGIRLTAGSDVSSVQGNTIQNINFTSSNTSTAISGIHLVTGSFNCGDTVPNLIGSLTTPGSITFNLSGTGPVVSGILAGLGTPGTIRILNNKIGGLTATGSGTINFQGIYIQTAATAYTVTGNTIGSPLAPLTNSTNNKTIGIYSTSPVADQLISDNIVQNLEATSATTSSQLIGISTPGNSGGNFFIRNNIVRNLSSACTTTSGATGSTLIGILVNATTLTSTGHSIQNNKVYGLYNSAPTQGVNVVGILYAGPTSGNYNLSGNLIHSFSTQSTSNSSGHFGIYFTTGNATSGSLRVFNNMIRLGLDTLGNSIQVTPIIAGIRKSATPGNISMFHNNIYIGGSGVNNGTANSMCLWRSTGSPTADSAYNNILFNARSNATSGGKHFACVWNSNTAVRSDNNIYYAPGTGGVLASVNGGTADLTTIAEIQGALSGYDLASFSSNPMFVEPSGTSSTVDLHLLNSTPAEGTGVAIPYVTTDYDNETRSALSPTDIGADAADFLNTSMSGTYTVGSGGDYLNLTGSTGFFDAINTHTVSGNITVNIISNLAEPGTIALNEWTEPASPVYTVTIQSSTTTQRIIANTGDLSSAMIRLNGADRVTFNGGAGKYLRFINNHTTPASGQPVFLFGNGSVSCSVTNCLVQSNALDPANAVIVAGSTGTNQLTLTGNEISDIPGVGYPASGVYSNNLNNTLTVTNNSVYNWSAFGLNLPQLANSLSVTGNSFYNNLPTSSTGSQTAIYVGSNGNHGINNNFIGGNSANASGIWTNSGSGNFTGIDLAFTGSVMSIIDGNVIRGISMTNTGASVFKGIHLSSGPALLGFLIGTGNTIGDTLTASSITLNGSGSYYAIHEETASTSTSIDKNNIANIVLTGTSGSPMFYGIRSNVADMSRNRIQKITCDQPGLTPVIYGIYNGCTDNTAAIGISNNMISISGGVSSNPVLYGYYDMAISGTNSRLYFNSISIHGSATLNSNTYTVFREGNSTLDIQNNILSNKRVFGGSGRHYSVYATTIFNWTSDYNNLYSSTGPLGFWGGLDRNNLTAWQTASNRDSHSVGGSPSFVSVDNLHLLTFTNCFLNANGTPIGGITTDFDNETRGSVPDIGADEFSPVVPSAAVSGGNKTACFGTAIPALTASGTGNIHWYSDPSLSTEVYVGNTFNTGQTAVGLHIYYVTNEVSGCESNMITVSLTIYELPVATASAVSSSVCAGNSIQLTGSASGGSGTGYIYAWGGPGGFTSSSQNPVYSNAQAAQSGSYMLTVTDSRNCISVPAGSVTITVTDRPSPAASAVQAAVCTGSVLSLTGSGSGGAGSPYTYNWSGPNGFSSALQNPSITNMQSGNAGTYYLTVTDVNSCASLAPSSVVVTVIPLPLADAGSNQTISNGTSTSLTATGSGGSGNYSYSWTPGAFINGAANTQTIQTINLSSTQVYTVTVTDNTTGCISQPDAVTVTITGSPLAANASAVSSQLCFGNSTQLNVTASGGSGSYSYTWSSVPAGFSSSSPNPSINPGQTTTYTVTVNDGFSTIQASTTVTVFLLPSGFASAVPTTLCTGSTLQLNGIAGGGSGTGFVYSWTGPGGWTSGIQNPVISNIQLSNGGVYSLHVADDRGCGSPVLSNVSITVNPRPTANAQVNPLSVCLGGTVNLSATATGGSGAYTYAWSGPGGYTNASQNPVLSNVQLNQGGLYSLVVNDQNGCSSTNSAIVNLSVNSLPVAGAATSTPSVCIGQTIQLNATASGGSGSGYQFSWTGPGGYTSTSQFPSIPNAVLANGGTYSLVVTDGNTCSSTVSSTSITMHALPVANAGTDVSIPNGTSTTLSGQGFGGTGNYSWTWTPASKINGNAFQQNIQTTNLTANQVYQLVIQDNTTGCVSNPDMVTVSVTGLALGVFADISDNDVCNGQSVQLTATAFGGSGVYSYSWTSIPAGFTSNIANPSLIAGSTTSYTVVVNDGFNSVSSSISLTVYPNPVSSASTPQPSLCTGESLLLNGSASGGSGSGYNFQWTGPNGYTSGLQNPVLSNIQSTYSGQFQLVVTDLHGCISNSSEVNVVVYSKPAANASVVDGTVCPGETISLNGLGSGGSGTGYTFSWTGPAGYSSSAQNPTISNAQSAQQGTYSLVVSDSHSCSSAASSVAVSVFSLPIVNAGLDQTIPNGAFTTLLASASGGSGNYSYAWSPVAFVVGNPNVALIQTANLSATQTYAVVATDNTSSCVSNPDNVTVFVTGGALSLSINSTSNTVCQGTSVLLTPVVSGGSGSYSYSWTSSPAGFTSALPSFAIAPSITTTYILVVNDGFNSISSSKTINVNSLPTVTLPASMGQMCIDASVLALSGGFPAGGTYSGAGVSSGSFNPSVAGAGTHVISYQFTDGNGCSKTATSSITVYALPVVTFDNLLSPLCESAAVSIISGGLPLGGTYSGPGISGTSFNASVAGPGNHTITYTYADINGCLSSDNNALTVHTLPVVTFNNIISPVCISASPFVLSGGNPVGGTYSGPGISAGSINPGLAGAGNHEIIYRFRNANNCESSDTNQILINDLPLSYGITGGGSYCTGENGLTVVLNGSALNTTYQLFKNGIASGLPVPGTGSSINWTLLTTGTYTVKATSLSTSCISDMTGNAIITEVSLPTVFNLAGSGTYCNGTNGKSITLSSSETGVLYQLYKNGIAEGTALTGNGGMLSWNNKLIGTYTVIGTSACSESMAGTVTITEDPLFTTAISPDPAYVIINQSISLSTQQNGGTGIYTNYAWNGPGSVYLNSTSIPIPDFSSPVVGNFTVNIEVTDSHGCIATNNLIVHVTSIVWEPLMMDKLICGTGVATMLASIGPGGNEIQFSLDGITPIFTDVTAPYEYTTPVIIAGNDLMVYARARNSITGLTSTWISAEASALTGSVPGYVVGFDTNLCANTTTGPMTLMEYKGDILRWQRRINNGNWVDIAFTEDVYQETPVATGVIQYRAVVRVSVCDETFSTPIQFVYTAPTNPGELTGTLATVCVGSSTGLMSVNNNNGVVYQWERSYNTGPWVVVSNGGATFSDVPAQPGNWNYRAMVVNGVCTPAYTNVYTVSALAAPTGGTLSGGGQICFGSYTPTMILSGNTGPVLNWQRRFNSGSWVDIVNTGSWYEEIPPVAGTYNYRVLIEGFNCPDIYSSISTVQVLPQSLAGVVNGSANICLGSSTGYLTLSSYYGTIVKWQRKYESGNWTDITHFSATYQETPVSPGTWYYRALVQNGVCGLSFSSVASIGVSPPAVGGSIAGGSVICVGNSTGILTLNGYTGSILKWQRRLNGGNWTDINQQLSTFSEMLNQSGSYEYRAQVQNGGCAPVYSALGIVEVTPLTVAGVTSGAASLCYGETGPVITLSGHTGSITGWQKRLNGGSWTDIQNTAVTYQEIPVSAGTWEYRAVVKNGNCNVAYSSVTSVVVNPLPTIFTVSGNPILCAGSQGASLNLSGSQSGYGYQLFKDGIAQGFPKQGTGSPLQWTGLLPGLYTVSASGTATFCYSEMQGELEITEYPLPGVFSVTTTSFDCGNLGTGGINLSGSETGISYQLLQNQNPVGLPLIGTGQEIDWISIYTGNYQIQATNQLSGCQATMTGIAVVQGAPLPQVFTVTGGGSACQNSAGVSIGLSGSQPSIQYVLYYNYDQLGTGLTGTGQALNFGLQQSGGSYTVVGSNLNSGCRIAMNGSATVNILPAPVVELGPDIDLLYGGSVILSPQISPGLEPYTYLWTPSTALSNTSALNPVANPLNNITYTLKVTGNNNCFTTDQVTIYPFLPDGQSVVSGRVTYANTPETPLQNIPVYLKNSSGAVVAQGFTNANGEYMFQPFPNGLYTLTAGSDQSVGGINSTDALRILKQFVQIQSISGIWLKAADVDASNYVNSIDALAVQLYFVGSINAFVSGKWVFDKITVNFTGGIFYEAFKGLCYGDVNGSYIPYAKSEETVPVVTQNILEAESGQEVIIPVYISESLKLGAVSLSLAYDPGSMEILDASLPGTKEELIRHAEDGEFHISYVTNDYLLSSAEKPFILLKARVYKSCSIMEVKGEFADPYAQKQGNVFLKIPGLKIKNSGEQSNLVIFPNPTKGESNLNLELLQDADVSVQLFDSKGSLLRNLLQGHFAAGNIMRTADLSKLPAGMYLVKCQIDNELPIEYKIEIIP